MVAEAGEKDSGGERMVAGGVASEMQ